MNNENQGQNKINIIDNNFNISKESNERINKETKAKLKILNKYFKLEKLKHQEKISRLQDEFIDPIEKPGFYFMRNESKNKSSEYKPVTNYCNTYRKKPFSTLYKKYVELNGFRNNNIIKKTETEVSPNNFEDIISAIELKDINNNLSTRRHLLNKKNHLYLNLNNKINLYENEKSKNKYLNSEGNEKRKKVINNITKNILNVSRINKIKLLKTKKNKNFTFSSFNEKKDFSKNSIIEDKKKKMSSTSRNEKKNYINKTSENNKNSNYIYKNLKIERDNSSTNSNSNTKNLKLNLNLKINKNIKYIIRNSNLNSSNRNLSCYTTTFKSFSKSISKYGKKSNIFKKIEKQVLNPDSFFNIKNNNYKNNIEKTEFKTTNQIINRIINDGKIIDNYILNNGIVKDENYHKIDKEKILLKLAEKLRKNKLKKEKLKFREHKKLTDEEIFAEKLSKVEPKFAKKFFREIYKKILFDKRILNKHDKDILIEKLEEQREREERNQEIKKEAYQQMKLTNDNIVTERDDQNLLNNRKLFTDYYGTLDGLEWLINKKHIINFGNKWIGAFNPRGKSQFQINYDDE